MNYIKLNIDEPIKNENFAEESTILIDKKLFPHTEDSRIKVKISFVNCNFNKLIILNTENISLKEIQLSFSYCFIKSITVENIVTKNISIFLGSTIFSGAFRSPNITRIYTNNCILNSSVFFVKQNDINISFTEENIFLIKWIRLLKNSNSKINNLLLLKQSYNIFQTKHLLFSYNERREGAAGKFENAHYAGSDQFIGYNLSDEEKDNFKVALHIQYDTSNETQSTKIINARLTSLSITGYMFGELKIDNTKIDEFYIHSFSTDKGASFFNIRPLHNCNENTKLEIRETNLDNISFDNVCFKDYNIVSIYRTKFGNSTLSSCEFTRENGKVDYLNSYENVHNPKENNQYTYRNRYEVLLQIKKLLKESGNIYDELKFQAISKDALKKIKDVSFWDRLILKINGVSNNHGLSITRPFLFLIVISIILYTCYLYSLGKLLINIKYDVDYNLVGYYFSFFDITHKLDFLVDKEELNGLAIFIDFLNKILLGFFIYQFIAAFRKYGKK